MKVSFWGVRGSRPTPDAAFLKYGGNTNCLVVRGRTNHYFVLDAGTGLARFSTLLSPSETYYATILLTHLHLYHIIGFQFSPLTYSKKCHTKVLGPSTRFHSLEDVFDHILSPIYSPVYGLDNLMANVQFEEITPAVRQVDDMTITGMPFAHSEDTDSWGYRLQNESGALVYLTDVILHDKDQGISPAAQQLAANADILVVGADTPEMYTDAIELARLCQVRHLVFSHHHPEATDEYLDRLQRKMREKITHVQITLAMEGMTLEI
jgi:ribonuclease BN (tRNA processing enzyme)